MRKIRTGQTEEEQEEAIRRNWMGWDVVDGDEDGVRMRMRGFGRILWEVHHIHGRGHHSGAIRCIYKSVQTPIEAKK